jgi:hypothetical protein
MKELSEHKSLCTGRNRQWLYHSGGASTTKNLSEEVQSLGDFGEEME